MYSTHNLHRHHGFWSAWWKQYPTTTYADSLFVNWGCSWTRLLLCRRCRLFVLWLHSQTCHHFWLNTLALLWFWLLFRWKMWCWSPGMRWLTSVGYIASLLRVGVWCIVIYTCLLSKHHIHHHHLHNTLPLSTSSSGSVSITLGYPPHTKHKPTREHGWGEVVFC